MKVKDIYNHKKWEKKEKFDHKKFNIEKEQIGKQRSKCHD